MAYDVQHSYYSSSCSSNASTGVLFTTAVSVELYVLILQGHIYAAVGVSLCPPRS